jgi:hypothetical protein
VKCLPCTKGTGDLVLERLRHDAVNHEFDSGRDIRLVVPHDDSSHIRTALRARMGRPRWACSFLRAEQAFGRFGGAGAVSIISVRSVVATAAGSTPNWRRRSAANSSSVALSSCSGSRHRDLPDRPSSSHDSAQAHQDSARSARSSLHPRERAPTEVPAQPPSRMNVHPEPVHPRLCRSTPVDDVCRRQREIRPYRRTVVAQVNRVIDVTSFQTMCEGAAV